MSSNTTTTPKKKAPYGHLPARKRPLVVRKSKSPSPTPTPKTSKKFFDSADWVLEGVVRPPAKQISEYYHQDSKVADATAHAVALSHLESKPERKYFDSADWAIGKSVPPQALPVVSKKNKYGTKKANPIVRRRSSRGYWDSADWAMSLKSPAIQMQQPKVLLSS
eukprot:TRINITY_DN33025_c0_g1_i4.p1 TRINITY_DN33025_c0_g1~~TRINITY_DN33025_c0_g1_i4.p1  ORF type:complete len:180 (-),score=33.96 TRINITY_DN33025_c0_g1_i4:168-662(-)